MPPFLLSVLASRPAQYAIAIGAALVALAVAAFRLIGMGRKIERSANNEKAVEAGNVRTQVDVDVGTAVDAERQRMRGRWTRD